MIYKSVVIESFEYISEKTIIRLKKTAPVYVVEPFAAFHRRKGKKYVGFPNHLPEYATALIQKGELQLLTGPTLKNQEISRRANDQAVENIHALYREYQIKQQALIQTVSQALRSPIGANAFKISLCERLAIFYSVNLFLNRLEKLNLPAPILVYVDTNLQDYHSLKTLHRKSHPAFYEHDTIQFPWKLHLASCMENVRKGGNLAAKLSVQTLVSFF